MKFIVSSLVALGTLVACGSPFSNLNEAKKSGCEGWYYKSNPSWKKIKADLGVEVTLDCKSIEDQLNGVGPDLRKEIANTRIPNLLKELETQIPKIQKLESQPKKIVLAYYSDRGSETGAWAISINELDGRAEFFVDREIALQPLEKSLFGGKIFLSTGTHPSSMSTDNTFKPEYEGKQLTESIPFLNAMKDTLLAHQAEIRTVVLPLGTNLIQIATELEYAATTKAIVFPTKIGQEATKVYLNEVVPQLASLQANIGNVYVQNLMSRYIGDLESEVYDNPDSRYTQFVFKRFAAAVERVNQMNPELKAALVKHNVRMLRMNILDGGGLGFGREVYHNIENEILNLWVGEMDLDDLRLISADSAKKCLKKMAESRIPGSDYECRVTY